MNTAISLIRIATLLALATLGIILIFGEEQDNSLWGLLFHILVNKSVGIGSIYAMIKLYKRWSTCDRWLIRFEAWNTKADEKSNLLHRRF